MCTNYLHFTVHCGPPPGIRLSKQRIAKKTNERYVVLCCVVLCCVVLCCVVFLVVDVPGDGVDLCPGLLQVAAVGMEPEASIQQLI